MTKLIGSSLILIGIGLMFLGSMIVPMNSLIHADLIIIPAVKKCITASCKEDKSGGNQCGVPVPQPGDNPPICIKGNIEEPDIAGCETSDVEGHDCEGCSGECVGFYVGIETVCACGRK